MIKYWDFQGVVTAQFSLRWLKRSGKSWKSYHFTKFRDDRHNESSLNLNPHHHHQLQLIIWTFWKMSLATQFSSTQSCHSLEAPPSRTWQTRGLYPESGWPLPALIGQKYGSHLYANPHCPAQSQAHTLGVLHKHQEKALSSKTKKTFCFPYPHAGLRIGKNITNTGECSPPPTPLGVSLWCSILGGLGGNLDSVGLDSNSSLYSAPPGPMTINIVFSSNLANMVTSMALQL